MLTVRSPFSRPKFTSSHFFLLANNFRSLGCYFSGRLMANRRFKIEGNPIYFPKFVNAIMAIQRLLVSRTQMSFCFLFFFCFTHFSYRYFAYLSLSWCEREQRTCCRQMNTGNCQRAHRSPKETNGVEVSARRFPLFLYLKAQRSSRLETQPNVAYSVMPQQKQSVRLFMFFIFDAPA